MAYTTTTSRPVSLWLYGLAALVCIMILVGGATRLTDSGLSITEWNLVSGALPPLSEAAWLASFEAYQQSSEYQLQNMGMTLEEFREIFWWEWGHRQLGRFIGLYMAIPLVVFWLRGALSHQLKPRLVGLMLLIGLQGAVGWWMVASGLVDRVDVSQYRLATHLAIAFVILGIALWLAVEASEGAPPIRSGSLTRLSFCIWGLVLFQIVLGAFVAGLDAGKIYNTWPLMEGQLIPDGYLGGHPFFSAIFESHAAVQMHHRWTGYLAAIGVGYLAWRIYREPRVTMKPFMVILPALVLAQMSLGIAALLSVVPLHLGLAHQAGAVILFVAVGAATWTARRSS